MPPEMVNASVGRTVPLKNTAFEVEGVVSGPWMKSIPSPPTATFWGAGGDGGVDCGFSAHAGSGALDPEVAWAKLAALGQGAQLAGKRYK